MEFNRVTSPYNIPLLFMELSFCFRLDFNDNVLILTYIMNCIMYRFAVAETCKLPYIVLMALNNLTRVLLFLVEINLAFSQK